MYHSYSLRNRSIARLAIAVIIFLMYGGVAIYFNHYVHRVNSEAVDMFFTIQNRAIYATTCGTLLKEGISNDNKTLVSRNTSSISLC